MFLSGPACIQMRPHSSHSYSVRPKLKVGWLNKWRKTSLSVDTYGICPCFFKYRSCSPSSRASMNFATSSIVLSRASSMSWSGRKCALYGRLSVVSVITFPQVHLNDDMLILSTGRTSAFQYYPGACAPSNQPAPLTETVRCKPQDYSHGG